jgi:hypothetical protein
MSKSVFKTLAEEGAEEALKYFRTPPEQRDDKRFQDAMGGIKAGRNFASLYSAETNRLATQVTAAKAIGLSGDALIPVFEEISGMEAKRFLPSQREHSNATPKAGKRSRKRNQSVK